ncbi:MAG: DUF5689 domain-containing protein [Bacteroidaceae bacterium]|nr:DUF5689 domain-containing protein [Bacteroidaceae bacterium]
MKKILLSLGILASFALSSCMDGGYDAVTDQQMDAAYGNQEVKETNRITIQELKAKYNSTVFASSNTYHQIKEPTQLRGWVTGNDIQGNIYSEITMEDESGEGILICISQGGLFGALPVGAEIIVELKDLYIGGYGKQPEIGTPYTNSNGKTYVSRMNPRLWQQHYKRIGFKENVQASDFDLSKIKDEAYLQANCGKLMTLNNVSFQKGGTATYAPEAEKDAANCVPRYLKDETAGKNIAQASLQIRTSTYAKFAAEKLPEGKLNITGVFTRYNDTWQVLIRDLDDVKPAN